MRLLATDRRRIASVDGKFEVKDGKFDASAIETVPVRLDDIDNSLAGGWRNVGTKNEIFVKFGEVTSTIPNMDVSADVDKRFRWMANGGAKLFKFKNAIVDIVAIIHGDITVDGLGAPDFGRYLNNESGCVR
jgi:hypothetical protein